MNGASRYDWPDGRAFAFSIFDDTDLATVDNVRPVYDFLADLGLRTTKSVWPVDNGGQPAIGGSTLDDAAYRDWTLDLRARGFEIGYHGASSTTSARPRVMAALDRFRDVYGHDPRAMANHSGCRESIYWGPARVGGGARLAYRLMTRFSRDGAFRGEVDGDPLFWGDLCAERIRYVRNFTFSDVDTLAACPRMPYHDPARPYVNLWFAGSEGANPRAFAATLSEPAQERLEAAGSACIMYTHLAAGFWQDGRLEPRFRALMERLAARNGWFVPVSTLLDHLATRSPARDLRPDERAALERRWLRSKIRVGPS